ncbi:regulatory protein RecX [Schleiferia thermophila]|jgi:regulatory protein|uniref:regulatory protein RecX n=1 Tax=Schleiferia thermophila TaxID=884107 RepID=UPI0004E66AAC|nr:regulatory protein RecX [Schleiferia thermophila]KFD38493.1 recombinase RecX [Schleiferia thermophila str. Yellowstone]PMB35846.1 RecX family transcriptional regulator [Fischerella thermalis CCMEE 5319]
MDTDKLKTIRKSLTKYCSYRDRTLVEVKNYIKRFSLTQLEEDSLILELVESNLVDEYRFARHYASGKFRINGWGREKISYNLRQKGFSESIIRIALSEIDDEEYQIVLAKHIRAKKRQIHLKPGDERGKNKIIRHLISKGFEYELVRCALENNENL